MKPDQYCFFLLQGRASEKPSEKTLENGDLTYKLWGFHEIADL